MAMPGSSFTLNPAIGSMDNLSLLKLLDSNTEMMNSALQDIQASNKIIREVSNYAKELGKNSV
jgi:hypothetical protein